MPFEREGAPRKLTPEMLARVGREDLIKKMTNFGALRELPPGRERPRDPQTKAVLPWSGIRGEAVQQAITEYLTSKKPDRMLAVARENILSQGAGAKTEGMMQGADVFIFVLDKLGMEVPPGLKTLKEEQRKAALAAKDVKTAKAA